MTTHLIPTAEEFAKYAQALAEEIGGVPLDPANRTTSCGRRMGRLATTTSRDRVTCKTCARAVAA